MLERPRGADSGAGRRAAHPGVWLAGALLGLAACDSAVEARPGAADAAPLTDPAAWVAVAGDAFPDHRPEGFSCPIQAYGVEGDVFEVDTGECEYLAVSQPARAPVAAGDVITGFVAHFPLVAEAPAEAHVGIAFAGAPVWEARVPIPSPERRYPVRWTAPADAPAGTPIQLHLHNHGRNAWFVGALTRSVATRPAVPDSARDSMQGAE